MTVPFCIGGTAAALVATLGTPASAAPVAMTVAPPVVTAELGKEFTVRSTIRYDDSSTPTALIAHLTVFSVKAGTYVDPEDWSSDRTRYLKPIPPGGATTILWRIRRSTGVPSRQASSPSPQTPPPPGPRSPRRRCASRSPNEEPSIRAASWSRHSVSRAPWPSSPPGYACAAAPDACRCRAAARPVASVAADPSEW